MKVIKVKEILVDDDVYEALERETKELGALAANCTPTFEVTIGNVIDMAVQAYGQRLIDEQKEADALTCTEEKTEK